MDADTGEILGENAIMAGLTVTMCTQKRGFANPNAARFLGDIRVANLRVPPEAIERAAALTGLVVRPGFNSGRVCLQSHGSFSRGLQCFAGAMTALITPFRDGRLDEARLKEQVERQIRGGVSGVVPVGTTGESPTLTVEEHERVIEQTVKIAAGG